jgi:CheY-like chemotaxis protein
VVWTTRAYVATVRLVSRPTEDQPTGSQRVRFSFDTTSLRQAVDVAGQLRRLAPNGVQVRPAPFSRIGGYRWAILLTTGPLEGSGIAAFEEEMRRVAWQAPGLRFTGWMCVWGAGDAVPTREPAATVQAPVRVLIVDDSAPFRQAARELLECRGFRVVGETDGAASGFEAVERLEPDAVLLDVRLPDGSGLDLCELLTREQGAPAVLLVSSDGAADGALAKARGARGFVSKADLAHVDLHGIWA